MLPVNGGSRVIVLHVVSGFVTVVDGLAEPSDCYDESYLRVSQQAVEMHPSEIRNRLFDLFSARNLNQLIAQNESSPLFVTAVREIDRYNGFESINDVARRGHTS